MSGQTWRATLTCLAVLASLFTGSDAWLFGRQGSAASDAKTAVAIGPGGEAGRFELKTSDDKFLLEAQPFLQLSPLDKCNYRVINHLKKSCSDMAEEELNKMAVHLLNCQLYSEKRKMYDCEESMSIAECTSDMDPTTWNAYQIVANRARAVCYATRQQIFRIKTEAAVNKLVSTSQKQIVGMEKLTADQLKLGEMTSDALDKVDASQREMLHRHEKIKISQTEMESHIVKNLKSLSREKALIAAGQKEIADMTEGLKAKLERASEFMEKQGEAQGETHEEILKDLALIREQAQEVMEKMTGNAEAMAAYQSMTHSHYEETLASLRQVNDSVNFVITTVDSLREGLYAKLGWLEVALGGTGDKVAFLKTVCSHILYLLLAVLSALFLRTPAFTRLFLLILIPLNALSEIRRKSSLDFGLMTLFILLTAAANSLLGVALALFASSSSSKARAESSAKSDGAVFEADARRAVSRADGAARRKRSGSRSRRARISSSSSSEEEGESTVDPTFVPDESSVDSTLPTRLSSTLISNEAHLTAKFGQTDQSVSFPDRTASDTAMLALRLPPVNGALARLQPRSVLAPLTLNASALGSGGIRAGDVTIGKDDSAGVPPFLPRNEAGSVDSARRNLSSTISGAGRRRDSASPHGSHDELYGRIRRRSSSRGRSLKDSEGTSERRSSDKENQLAEESLRSQSLITSHFSAPIASRSLTPTRLSATIETRAPKTPPRSKTPPRNSSLTREPCAANTKSGALCSRGALPGKPFCGIHLGRSPAK